MKKLNWTVSCSTVKNTIQSLATRTGSLDPFPTYVIKNHVDLLSPVMTRIVNQSPSAGEFRPPLKLSHVRPRLKKDNLDKEILKKYRSVANIHFPWRWEGGSNTNVQLSSSWNLRFDAHYTGSRGVICDLNCTVDYCSYILQLIPRIAFVFIPGNRANRHAILLQTWYNIIQCSGKPLKVMTVDE